MDAVGIVLLQRRKMIDYNKPVVYKVTLDNGLATELKVTVPYEDDGTDDWYNALIGAWIKQHLEWAKTGYDIDDWEIDNGSD